MPKKKVCVQCGSSWVVNSYYSLCDYHNNKRLLKSKPKKKFGSNNEFRESQRLKDGSLQCEGCGIKAAHHDVSHLIPVSIRPDLKEHVENMQILCRDCHNIWEHKKSGVELLFCYRNNLNLISKMDKLYFNRNYATR